MLTIYIFHRWLFSRFGFSSFPAFTFHMLFYCCFYFWYCTLIFPLQPCMLSFVQLACTSSYLLSTLRFMNSIAATHAGRLWSVYLQHLACSMIIVFAFHCIVPYGRPLLRLCDHSVIYVHVSCSANIVQIVQVFAEWKSERVKGWKVKGET